MGLQVVLMISTKLEGPLLLCPCPFSNGAMASAKLSFAGAVVSAAGGTKKRRQRIEVKGLLLPCAMRRMCSALESLVDAEDAAPPGGGLRGFRCTVKTEEDSKVFASR